MGRIIRNTAKTLVLIGLAEPIITSLKGTSYDSPHNQIHQKQQYRRELSEGLHITPRMYMTTNIPIKWGRYLAC